MSVAEGVHRRLVPARVRGGQRVRLSAEAGVADEQRVAAVEHPADARHSQLHRVLSSASLVVSMSRVAGEQRPQLARRRVALAAAALHAPRSRHFRSVQSASREARCHQRAAAAGSDADQRAGGLQR